jgi:hypothetical protein
MYFITTDISAGMTCCDLSQPPVPVSDMHYNKTEAYTGMITPYYTSTDHLSMIHDSITSHDATN